MARPLGPACLCDATRLPPQGGHIHHERKRDAHSSSRMGPLLLPCNKSPTISPPLPPAGLPSDPPQRIAAHATNLRPPPPSPPQDSLGPGAPRLLVNYLNQSVNALDLIPPVLRQYMSSLVLDSSSIQIMDFDTESVLQEALKYLRAETSECMRLAEPPRTHEGPHHAWSLRSRSAACIIFQIYSSTTSDSAFHTHPSPPRLNFLVLQT